MTPEKVYQKLEKIITTTQPKADTTMLRLAFEFAERAHAGQMRASGEPYINHPLNTAILLAEMHLNLQLIVAAILHDVPEDTNVTIEEIKKNFGDDIANMVAGVTKLGKIKYRGVERYIENLRKMFVAMAEDVRVIIIKFADRLHNLRTLGSLPPKKQFRIALESLEIFAPIAHRLGMGEMKGQLEDEAFKYVYPKEYLWVKQVSEPYLKEKGAIIEKIKNYVARELKKEKISFDRVEGRTKRLYSLYTKLLRYDRDIVKIYDLIALRIIVPDVATCYAVLGIIHKLWRPLKGRIKDYIAQPKPNGYRSLHTTVFCDGDIVEFQIRTEEMHDEAEYGIAAHWHYDEAGSMQAPAKKLMWVQELANIQKEAMQRLRDLETLKIDVFRNRIFVFTPKGDVIDLPEDATTVDFAYAIHTDVGNQCIGARVNDHLVPLDRALKSGDIIEIIVDRNRKGPSADWLKFVKTHYARTNIKQYAKQSVAGWFFKVLPGKKK